MGARKRLVSPTSGIRRARKMRQTIKKEFRESQNEKTIRALRSAINSA